MLSLEDFICQSNKANTIEELCKLFQNGLAKVGYNTYRYGFLSDHKSIGKPANHGLQYNFPEEWMKHYIEKGYLEIDPVKQQLTVSRQPFCWDKIDYFVNLMPAEKKVLNEASEAGLLKGIGLAVHTAPGEVAGFGIATNDKTLDVSCDTVAMIHLLAVQFHHRYIALLKMPEQVVERITFTPKQKDVFSWAAQGKSSSEISEILGISTETVNYHLKQCYQKLGVNNKIQGVTKAIFLGLIDTLSPKFNV